MPKEDDIDDGEWKEFEIEFNTAVDNLRKVADEKFKNKDTTFIKGIRNFTKRLGNSVTNDKILAPKLYKMMSSRISWKNAFKEDL